MDDDEEDNDSEENDEEHKSNDEIFVTIRTLGIASKSKNDCIAVTIT